MSLASSTAAQLESVKRDVRAIVMAASRGGMAPRELQLEYQGINGVSLPYSRFNYDSVLSFLKAIPDTVRVSPQGQLFAVSHVSTTHLEVLISEQKQSKKDKAKTTRVGRAAPLARPPPPPPPPPPKAHVRVATPPPVKVRPIRLVWAPPRQPPTPPKRPAAAVRAPPARVRSPSVCSSAAPRVASEWVRIKAKNKVVALLAETPGEQICFTDLCKSYRQRFGKYLYMPFLFGTNPNDAFKTHFDGRVSVYWYKKQMFVALKQPAAGRPRAGSACRHVAAPPPPHGQSRARKKRSDDAALALVGRALDEDMLRAGVKAATKALNGGRARLVVMAADAHAVDAAVQLQYACMDKSVPCVLVESQSALGRACRLAAAVAVAAIVDSADSPAHIRRLYKDFEKLLI